MFFQKNLLARTSGEPGRTAKRPNLILHVPGDARAARSGEQRRSDRQRGAKNKFFSLHYRGCKTVPNDSGGITYIMRGAEEIFQNCALSKSVILILNLALLRSKGIGMVLRKVNDKDL